MIYTTHQTAQILSSIDAILNGNNGYARLWVSEEIADAVRFAGFVVFRSTDLHGKPCWFGSTKAAQESLSSAPYGVSTYKAPIHTQDLPDYEDLILARQERQGMYD
jgi:hypothetical protein